MKRKEIWKSEPMSRRPLSAADLEAHLREQLGALQRSTVHFDDGYHAEARRMAVILRILLHTNANGPSLLKRLGRDEIDFVDSAPPFDPDNLMASHGLVSINFGGSETSYGIKLDAESPAPLTPFVRWWEATVFSDHQNRHMSRSDVVRTAANQDGGAHVDGALGADYAALRHENSLGWVDGQGSPLAGDPAYLAVRQIAHEVLKTLIPGYSKTNEEVHASRKQSEIAGGKLRFFPHQKLFFKSATVAPLVPGLSYIAVIVVDSVTTGCVRMVVNSTVSEPVTAAGAHTVRIVAGQEQNSGVYGEYTDAVIDRVSIKQAPE